MQCSKHYVQKYLAFTDLCPPGFTHVSSINHCLLVRRKQDYLLAEAEYECKIHNAALVALDEHEDVIRLYHRGSKYFIDTGTWTFSVVDLVIKFASQLRLGALQISA